ncbi:hypothetical protein [Burkholderia mayonis]|uniref:Uncharacterized protein n=1 Tax=Burkholderia mayonis TaxID=1385591 RepID=A0A1B4FUI7_9BURK|nr:hypothetical protein [Burkholderia mayonis]AOJ07345.1 hypothetical protein WS71_08520 [Burkholderia mayonis]KVE45833.1 hypothetical protein WS71_23595 [Burkholderia mayonis]
MRADIVVDTLLSIRELPKRMADAWSKAPASGAARRFGFDSFTFLRRDERELSLGLVCRFWRPNP